MSMPANKDNAPAVTWNIVSQLEGIQADESGQFTRGVTVSFRTSSGLTGSVFVPEASYNTPNVLALITQRVRQMQAISNLSGPVD